MDTLDHLRLDPDFMQNVTAWERRAAIPARHGPTPAGLHPNLLAILKQQGLLPLYSHQSAAVQAALDGENLVIVTATASGKTLAYNLPVLHSLMAQPGGRALYLFPTKALAQDQAAALSTLTALLDIPIWAATYDGDTPRGRRSLIRRDADIILSNPDMLHSGILPYHPRWASFFANLRYVVIDELHTYRGIFGSHVANLLRRLRRICHFHGSQPQFICTSATIANPHQLAETLIEAPVRLIDDDGAPQPEKHIILYNPPLLDPASGLRRPYTLESQRLAGQFLGDDVQTVVFARARVTTELLLGYLRDHVQQAGGDPEQIRGYRGGYLASERRAIEQGLRDGSVRGVVATNALELGVDIGQLGAAVIAGYPGTISSLWQQAGRVGRRDAVSVVILVASAAPLDQYVARNPRYLFESSPEHGLVNPNNLALVYNHLRCALFELPFNPGERFGRFEQLEDLLELMDEAGEAHHSADARLAATRWIGGGSPAIEVSLRTGSANTVLIQDIGGEQPRVVGEVDAATAPVQVHAGAIYTHEGRQYHVEDLDWEEKMALVRPAEVDYYTRAVEDLQLEVLDIADADERLPARRAFGEVLVRAQAVGYRQIKLYTHEILGFGEIDLPPREFQTMAYWLWIAPEMVKVLEAEDILTKPLYYGPNWQRQRAAARERDGYCCRQCGTPESDDRQHHVHHVQPFRSFGYVAGENEHYRQANHLDNLLTLCPACHHKLETARRRQSALNGLAHALANLAPLHLMCDPGDINYLVELRSLETGAPTITIYERLPDGTGMSAQLYKLHTRLLEDALALVRDCPCDSGCPACIGPAYADLDTSETKGLTVRLAEALLGRE